MLGIQLGNSAGAIFTCILSVGFSFYGSWVLALVLLGGESKVEESTIRAEMVEF